MYFFTFNEMITFDGIFLRNDVINLLNFRSDRAVSDPWNTNRQPWGESCISTVILASLRTTSLRLFSFFCRCSWGEIVSATFKRWLSDVLGVVCSVILSQRASFHCIAHIPPFFTHTTLFSTWMPKILPPQRSLCRWRTHLTTFCVARWLGIYNVGWLSSTFHA